MLKKPWICPACRSRASTRCGSGGCDEVRDELRGDRHPGLNLPVLPGIAVVGKDRGDALRRRPLEGVDHHQELHQVVVDRWAGGLDHEDVGPPHVLVDLDEDLSVGEARRPLPRPRGIRR